MPKNSPGEGVGGAAKTIDKQAYFRKIGYQPHSDKQAIFHASQARFKIPCCGRRFGKSMMSGTDTEPRLLYPNRRVWIIGPTYDLGEKEFRVIWDHMIIKLGLGSDRRVKRAYNKKAGVMYIEFPWRTRLEVRSADHPENLVGESLHHVIMSEAAKHKQDTFERYVRAALADFRGSADFPSTPEGQNWYHQLWQTGQDPGNPEYESWRFPSWDNPVVYPGGRDDPEIKMIERTTTHEWFEQEIAADFTAFVGKIYGAFQESIHVRSHTFNPAWQNYIAFDWGYTNPMAAVEFQVSPQDTVHVWRVWYKSYMRVEEFLAMMQQTPNPEGYHVDLCFGDAADPGATKTVTEKFHPCISDPRAKSGTRSEDKDVKGQQKAVSGWREGVDLVNSFLKIREPSDTLDLTDMVSALDLTFAESVREPSLFIDHSCKDLIREFNNYRAPDNAHGTRNTREAAQPFADHALDALRYGLMHVFKLGVRSHLSDVYTVHDFAQSNPEMTAKQYSLDYNIAPEGGYFTTADLEGRF
jgi:hypothetical protein